MKYVALLRGINVGGNNIIKMLSLKEAFEKDGHTDVVTYIQSGNVIFSSSEKSPAVLTKSLEEMLSKTFGYKARVVVKSKVQIEAIEKEVPHDWNTKDTIRCYVAFLSDFVTSKDVAKEILLNEEVDSLKIGDGCLYLTTLLSGLTRSKFNRLASLKVYQEMTIRNYNTTKKIRLLMEN